MLNGTSLALVFPDSASTSTISPQKLQTLQDLLDALKGVEPDQLMGMLRSTAAHVSQCLGKPPGSISIEELLQIRPRLKVYLEEGRYKGNTIRTYLNYLRIMIGRAKELGWAQSSPAVEDAWQKFLPILSKQIGCVGIVRYAIWRQIMPCEFTETHLEDWGRALLSAGRTIRHVHGVKTRFRRSVLESGLSKDGPKLLPPPGGDSYAVSLAEFPLPFCEEVVRLMKWKTDRFSEGRPTKMRHRQVTGEFLQGTLCRLYGFAKNVKKMEVSSLQELLCKEIVEQWVSWCLNERSVKSKSLLTPLSMINSIVKSYPMFNVGRYDWLPKLISQLPEDSETLIKQRKELKWVDYDELARIPNKIRNNAEQHFKSDTRRMALAVRDQLVMAWMTTLPWRRRNLIECKFGKPEEGANLFKGEISASATMAKPRRVEEALKGDPHFKPWQFRFRPEGTKSRQAVHAILPKQLIPLLEEYLEKFRPILTTRADPNTLFVNECGGSFNKESFAWLVRNLTFRYTGKAVNPHLFRDIFAVKWLRIHPKDYLTLSKILWHRDIKTTIRIYGQNFDESDGAVAVEEWLEERSLSQRNTNS